MDYLPVPYCPKNEEAESNKLEKSRPRPPLIRYALYLICTGFALLTLVYCAVSAVNGISEDGGMLDYIINDVFGGTKGTHTADPLSSVLLQNFGVSLEKTQANGIDEIGSAIIPPVTDAPETDFTEDLPSSSAITSEELYEFDYSAIGEGENAIVPIDLSVSELRLNNETSYSPDLQSIAPPTKYEITDQPLALILHTHATEAFSEEGSVSYSESENVPRSADVEKNVVAVGKVMADVLNDAGIPTLHCEILHDEESYKDSYGRAAETIKKYLEEYPSIKYVFDVHRDSIISSDGTKYRPVTVANGKVSAQVMSVVGTDDKGANHPNWEKNLSLAVALEKELIDENSGIARAINLRGAAFNQQYTSGSLLLEIGSCGNTLSEAKTAGENVAHALAKIIKGD